MGQARHMIRLSLDIPAEQHVHLKILATKKGVSMREYILEALAFKEAAEEEDIEMPRASMFGECLHKTIYDKAAAYLFHTSFS